MQKLKPNLNSKTYMDLYIIRTVCLLDFSYLAFIKESLESIWRGMSKSKLYWLGAPVAYLLSSERDFLELVLHPSEISTEPLV